MKSPITGKEMELIQELKIVSFRKEAFEIVTHYYRCKDSGDEFESEELMELNLQQVYNQYRAKYQLPYPDEIKGIREKYQVSGTKMAEILGFGTNIYRNYENGEVPSISNARLIQLVKDPEEFRKLVELNSQLEPKEKEKIFNRIKELNTEENLLFHSFLEHYLLKDLIPGLFSGYKIPNLEKFCQMVVFFAERLKPWKVKMNKLLFYSDFGHFKRYGQSISGIQYIAITMGPVPNNFDGLLNWAREQECVNVQHHYFEDGVGERFIAGKRTFQTDLFSAQELKTLEAVALKFESTSTSEIVALSHEEPAWKENIEGRRPISYRYAFQLKNF